MRLLSLNRSEIIVLFSLLLFPGVILAQIPNHPYPRTAIWQWEGAPPDWYARFDLIFTRPKSSGFISEVRSMNPNVIFLLAKDINKSYEGINGFPEEWYLYNSRGQKIQLYGPTEFWTNLSDVCPLVNGEQLVDFLPRYYADLVSEADGFATDGLYYRVHLQWRMFDDVDMDRNGVNDLDEHGKSWVIDHWANGVDRMLSKMRQLLGEKVILINTGSSDTPGKMLVNGYVSEHEGSEYNWEFKLGYYSNLFSQVHQPPIFLMNNNPDGRDPQLVRPTKDYFSFMRFGLTRALLFGIYYEFEDIDYGTNEHYWNKYFDEFDIDLGYPTGSMREVKNGVWVRFFDKGAAIVNVSGNQVTVTDQELSSVNGYSGPYYRFRGGQAPEVNDGSVFTSIELRGYTYVGYDNASQIMGDGIILVKSPQTVVSDIIIDNVEIGTSPGSRAINLSGDFIQETDCGPGSNYYTLRCSWNPGSFPYAVSSSGSGQATFTPNIGVTGDYEVFEWHGSLPGSQASNVAYIINHAGGRTSKTVNQQIRAGQWNSLGTYTFNKGTSGNVTISSNGADGPVMADAIKFVFRDGDSGNGEADLTPPVPPKNVRVGN